MLTLAQLRQHVESALVDDALQRLLDDAQASVVERIGPGGPVTEYRVGAGSLLILTQRADAANAIAVTEAFDTTTPVELDPDDFRLSADGIALYRLDTGPNPLVHWAAGVAQVSYTAADDEARRDRVALDLVRLALAYQPMLTQESIDGYSYQHASNSQWNYQTEREAILASLAAPGLGFA